MRLAPKFSKPVGARAYSRYLIGALNDALADAEEAVRLEPDNPRVVGFRGFIYMAGGRYDKALADYNDVLRDDPNNADALCLRGLLQASCPDGKIRDGKKALEDAKRACELLMWTNPAALEAYAAACAETGDFAEAVKWQKKVLENPRYMKSKFGPDARKRLDRYEAKKPYRFEPRGKID